MHFGQDAFCRSVVTPVPFPRLLSVGFIHQPCLVILSPSPAHTLSHVQRFPDLTSLITETTLQPSHPNKILFTVLPS